MVGGGGGGVGGGGALLHKELEGVQTWGACVYT